MVKEQGVSYTVFLQELQKELVFHLNGGTSYRQKTAELSLEVAHKVGEVTPFFERNVAKQTVSCLLPNLDQQRVEDVAKMLHFIAKELYLNANLPKEVKVYVEQKRQYPKLNNKINGECKVSDEGKWKVNE
jgi:NurA-like 5'-3' nuclease